MNYLSSTDECVPCKVGSFGALFANDECTCPELSILNSMGECMCNDGYLMSDDADCILCDLETALFNNATGECSCEDGSLFYEGKDGKIKNR
jgi:hypothetical protein